MAQVKERGGGGKRLGLGFLPSPPLADECMEWLFPRRFLSAIERFPQKNNATFE